MNKNFLKSGIIGNPLSHSTSPEMHAKFMAQTGINGTYEKFEIKQEELPQIIEYLKNNNFSGFNVTIPYKVEILKYLDAIDENAQKIGAVNTVKIDNGKLIGYNTDIYGFIHSIPHNANIENAVLLGCGGAAMAVVAGLDVLGCKNLAIYARNIDKLNNFAGLMKSKTNITIYTDLLENLKSIDNTDIIINATPLGTSGVNQDKSAVDKDIFNSADEKLLAYDLVYNPPITKFLSFAQKRGLRTVNGSKMLLLQGAKAFEIWTGLMPDVKILLQ